ncbi:MAG TPA: DNA polymerase III subunit delta' [Rhizomicrobium sp.]|jgi:DNA polymerase-3 subunit delta'|nr:DNA polymerase III subunit delta' [Rhizomicrobium sp.]
MAKRVRVSEPDESDRIEGFPHPRECFDLIGQDVALMRAARAIRGGKPPQGWLITGPPGIGKATLAYRIARYLLAYGARDAGAEDLSVPATDAAAIQVTAGSHPGLLILKRVINEKTGKLMSELPVAEVRRLAGFFGMTSGAGGWRVAIVDTADDMNTNAANAILKLLEEPPNRAMLILLANRPGQLLPTIRSRCQRLELRPLNETSVADALKRCLPEADTEERMSLARLSGGAIGAALQLASGEGREMAGEADRLIDHAATPDTIALLALGERLSRMKDGLPRFGDFLVEALATRIRLKARQSGTHLQRWTELLDRLEDNFARSRGLNLEPRQTILSAARDLAATASRAGSL